MTKLKLAFGSMEMLDRIEKDCEEFANVEQKAKMEGRQLGMMLAPKSKKK